MKILAWRKLCSKSKQKRGFAMYPANVSGPVLTCIISRPTPVEILANHDRRHRGRSAATEMAGLASNGPLAEDSTEQGKCEI